MGRISCSEQISLSRRDFIIQPRVGRAQRPFHELVAADVRTLSLRAVRSESAVADTLSSVPRAAGGDRPRSQPSRTPCVRLSRRASRYGGGLAFNGLTQKSATAAEKTDRGPSRHAAHRKDWPA